MSITAQGQTLKIGGSSSVTYAVVIGISNYSNEAIPDLNYAHKDADAFVSYLKSNSGGNVSDTSIIKLINEEATTARIAAAMDWLIEITKEGDKAVIYFSGHGDVETKTSLQHGFLLSYDSPPTTYIAGAFPLFYLQSVITTLSITKNVEVLMFMDACRSGKLAGSSIGGTEASSAVLAKQFGKETKILSCQPNEFSLEGDQWGGGRGVFSYFLIEGLKGLADSNGDYQVNLLELERYLEDNVTNEVSPSSQIPMTVGNKSNIISYVDQEDLLELMILKEGEKPLFAMVDTRTNHAEIKHKDSTFYKIYIAFNEAIKNGNLIASTTNKDELSADEIYRQALHLNGWGKLKNAMKRNLAVSLQEDAQSSINKYLTLSTAQLTSNSFDNNTEIEENSRAARYLHRASELLGVSHYMYKDLKSKEKYFQGIVHALTANEKYEFRDSFLNLAIEVFEEGLVYVQDAPHIYIEMASVYSDLNEIELAISHAQIALELSPNWPIPYDLLAVTFYNLEDYKMSIDYAFKALNLQPDFENAFYLLVGSYNMLGEFDKVISLCKNKLKYQPENLAALLELGMAYAEIEKTDTAILILQKAKNLAPTNSLVYTHFGLAYLAKDSFELAHKYINEAISIDPQDQNNYHIKGSMFMKDGVLDSAYLMYSKILDIAPSDEYAIGQKGLISLQQNNKDEAFQLFAKAIDLNEKNSLAYFNFFCYYHHLDQNNLAFEWLEKSFEHGLILLIGFEEVINNECFQEIKYTPQYLSLIKKHTKE